MARLCYHSSVTELFIEPSTAAELLAAVSGLRRALRRRVGPAEGAAELSEAQRELIRAVRRQPGLRVSEAAAELRLAANTVSTLVTGLSASGWLRRETDPRDGRSAVLFLTPVAEKAVAQWRDRRLAVLSDVLDMLEEGERARIAQALPSIERLVDLLQEGS